MRRWRPYSQRYLVVGLVGLALWLVRKRFRVPCFGTGSGILEPVPCNRFLRQITTNYSEFGKDTGVVLRFLDFCKFQFPFYSETNRQTAVSGTMNKNNYVHKYAEKSEQTI